MLEVVNFEELVREVAVPEIESDTEGGGEEGLGAE